MEPGQRRWRGVDYQPDTRTGLIFTSPTDGTLMNPRSADKACAAIRDRAGLDIERFHAFRHAFTTLLRASGTRDRVAMKMTGHRDAAMLDYYDEGLESEQIEAAQRLDERLRMLHPGITGIGDLTPALHGWKNPVARVSIERIDRDEEA